MRLAIVGKTRSGKSTATHRFLSHALRHSWAGVILLDGKGSELAHYAPLPGVVYHGVENLETWASVLEAHVERMGQRYQALIARGLRVTPSADPRYLIVIDEVQKGTRAPKGLGKRIGDALTLLCEQSAALGDVVVVATQREVNAVPPSARFNVCAWLRMLGQGFYHLQADGQPTVSGRTGYMTPEEALATIANGEPPLPLTLDNLATILGSHELESTRAPATLYMGVKGSGKTYKLENHQPKRKVSRHIYIDLAQPHRQALVTLIEAAGAVAPPRVPIPQLVEIAALALQSESTLLLLDNLDQATDKVMSTIETLIESVAECALATKTPQTPAEERQLQPLVARVRIHKLTALSRLEALALLRQHLPLDIADPMATERRILELANGHPATLVDLATRTQRGSLEEVREYTSAQNKPINLSLLLVLPLFLLLLLWRADGYILAALTMLALFIVRRMVVRQLQER